MWLRCDRMSAGCGRASGEKGGRVYAAPMIVIRRLIDRHRAYTAIFLPGEESKVIPTSDYEHGRILQIYKQDRPHQDVLNDFTDFGLVPLARPEDLRPPA